ncbi:hypothetical protein E5K00_18960 [Hymenobacter aquaticus]|uniref:GSCFA domain-containing protein n=1 Tax=Hymenobacter aquaticus TaxID=1867101 RepID=A0A4Z0PYJ5_9BACT|nr:GSCFA domain-containing protein [Hymenobacter aquaticus]TGE22326.1 hypothetical protein E5K00_18960 [Hymenobacter aquaticus]
MFRTELPLTPHPHQLPLSTRVLTVGSCFSDTIGSRLAAAKVSTLVNPFGTVFNPLSACQLLRAAAGEDMDWQQHLVEARGRWQSYDLHATIGADSPVTLLQRIQGLLQEVGAFLAQTDVVVLTLGTAYAYRLLETDEVVNNCHKVPADRFEKVLLTPDEIINAVAETHAYLRRANPKLRFILTVSPVRHLKDTLPLNSVSKSVLRVACHYLSELLPDVSYFPAYELLLDDLRDYRFYAADMLHPSETAENYIWERFTRTYFDPAFGRFRKEWESVRQALGHRPLYPEAPEHREFLEATLGRLHRLAGQADIRAEIAEVERQLAELPLPKPQAVPEPEPDDDEERIDIGEVQQPLRRAEAEAAPVITAPRVSTPAPLPAAPLVVEEDEDQEEETADDEPEGNELAAEAPAFPKKKRRSRGGAKRTARKKAAQLYAQQLAEAAGSVTTQEEVAAPAAEEAPVAAEPVAPEAAVQLEEPAPAPVAVTTPEIEVPSVPVAPVATPRPVPRAAVAAPNVDWLQPMDEPESEQAPKPKREPYTRTKAARQPAEKKPRATKDRIITTPPRSSRRKPAPLYAEPIPEAEAPAVEAVPTDTIAPVEVAATVPAEVVSAAPVAATPVAAAPEAETAPVVAVSVDEVAPQAVPEAAQPEPKKRSRAKAAPRAKATPKAAAPVPTPAPETAPAAEEPKAAPKKRSRPPRKKPAADETPPAS